MYPGATHSLYSPPDRRRSFVPIMPPSAGDVQQRFRYERKMMPSPCFHPLGPDPLGCWQQVEGGNSISNNRLPHSVPKLRHTHTHGGPHSNPPDYPQPESHFPALTHPNTQTPAPTPPSPRTRLERKTKISNSINNFLVVTGVRNIQCICAVSPASGCPVSASFFLGRRRRRRASATAATEPNAATP